MQRFQKSIEFDRQADRKWPTSVFFGKVGHGQEQYFSFVIIVNNRSGNFKEEPVQITNKRHF